MIEPTSVDKLIEALKIINKYDIKWRVIGRGSNLLVDDEGIDGIVIKLGKGLDHLEVNGTGVRAGAGYSFIVLANRMGRSGLSGLEFAGGIPGSVGGAVFMNAGAHGYRYFKNFKESAITFSRWNG